MTEHRGDWFDRYQTRREALAELLTWDPFRDWNTLKMIESRVEQELFNGLEVAYASGLSDPSAVEFFRRACSVAERVVAEGRLESALCRTRFPKNRGTVHRAYAYARALLGEPLDTKALVQSSDDFLDWCSSHGKGQWDSQGQAYYLAAVRIGILVGETDRAQNQLKAKKSCKWHKDEYELWKQLCLKREAVLHDQGFGASLDAYFERFKTPRSHDVFVESEVLRLELVAIRDKYLVAEDGIIDWVRATTSVDE